MIPLPMIQIEDTPVAILAGGLGTRMFPVTQTMPKAMIPLGGKPFLEHQIELLKSQGIRHIVLCVGLMGDRIERCFGNGESWGVELYYSYDGFQQLGTAGALRKALPLLGKRFFVMYGDSYLPTALQPVLLAHGNSGAPALMTIHHNQDRWVPSNIRFSAERIEAYCKAGGPEFEYVDYGLSVMTPDVLREIPPSGAHDLGAVFERLIQAKALAGFEVPDRFYEIGSPEGLAELEQVFALRSAA